MGNAYNGLHRSHFEEKELRVLNAFKCLRIVRSYLPFASVVDFGCGIGGWLVAARELGATRTTGLEGEWIRSASKLVPDEDIIVADLATEKFDFSRSYDLAISIEVAEHLPAAAADLFCDNLVNASNVIVFSAAIPGQGGVNHVNEQPPQYWIDKFWQRGFVPLEMVRPAISNEPRMFAWLKQNVIVFMNYDLLHVHRQVAGLCLPRRHFYRYKPG